MIEFLKNQIKEIQDKQDEAIDNETIKYEQMVNVKNRMISELQNELEQIKNEQNETIKP